IEPIYRQVLETGKPVLGFEVHGSTPREPGVERDWVVSCYPLRGSSGAVAGVSCIVQEVTEHKPADQAVRQRAQEVEKLMEVVPVAVWIARDLECRQIIGNRAGYELLRVPAGVNLSKSAPPGESPAGFRLFHAGKEVPPDQLPMQYAAAHGVEVREYEE